MAVLWSIQLLGRLRLRQGERSISGFRTLKAAGVLAYLAYYRRSHSREALIRTPPFQQTKASSFLQDKP